MVGRPKVIPLHELDGMDETFAAADSFREFFELERDHLCDLLSLVTGDRSEAEEIAQDALVVVWERWDRVRVMDSPAGYLYRTAINTFRKRHRRAWLFGRAAASLSRRTNSAPADAAVMLSEALRALTPRHRAALVLTEVLGYSAEDAARALGVKVSTIGVLKHRGRAALRQEMEPPDD